MIKPLALVRSLPIWMCLAATGAIADPGSYFVRTNASGGALLVDGETQIELSRSDSRGDAFGSANLADGKLRAFVSGIDPDNSNSMWVDFGETLSVIGVTEATVVTLTMMVSGSLSGTVPYANARLQVGNAGFDCRPGVCLFDGPTSDTDSELWASPPDKSVDRLLSVQRTVTPENPAFSFVAALQLTANAGGTADFSNTATMMFELPPGLSFTSASGVFLSPIPEPMTAALFALGLGVLCARRKELALGRHAS
jgi:hypothetical protein